MDFIQDSSGPMLWLTALFITGFMICGAALIGGLTFEDGAKPMNKTARSFAIAGAISGPLTLITGLASWHITSQATPRDEVIAEQVEEFYGIQVTPGNLRELEYPLNMLGDDLEYGGTSLVRTGDNMGEFMNVTLATEDGKVFLLTQVGAEYEELERAR